MKVVEVKQMSNDNVLKPGQNILIPNLNFAESKTAENEVYNNPDVKDNYGKDILITDKDFDVYTTRRPCRKVLP